MRILYLLLLTTILSGCLCPTLNEDLDKIQAAVETSNATACETMGETMQTVCYSAMASSTGNLTFCEKIGLENMKASCYTTVATEKQNPEACERIGTAEEKTYCVLQVVSKTGDKTQCNRIPDEKLKQQCLSQ